MTARKHPKCAGVSVYSSSGDDHYCDYATVINCEDCKYNGQPCGGEDPEAAHNQLED